MSARPRRKTAPALPPTPLEQFIAADNAKQRKQPKTQLQREAAKGKRDHLEAAYLVSLALTTNVPTPQQQYTKLVPGHRYRADFAWPAPIKLIVEVDGGQWLGAHGGHTSAAGMERDRIRDARCLLAGWTVLRVTASMIADNSAAYYTAKLYKMLAARRQQQGVA